MDVPTADSSNPALRPTDHDLTVLVPSYNEESRLPATLDGLREFLDDWGIDYRVVVIDDGSDDRTASITERYDFRFSTISKPQGGKGAAVRLGMLSATGRVIAFTDADLPYELSALRDGYEAIEANDCAVVFGARDDDASECRAKRRFVRQVATAVFRGIVSRLISREISDTQCGLKVFSREAALSLFSRATIDGFAFDAEVVFLTQWLGVPWRRVPVTLINEYASTLSLSRHALPMLMDVLRVQRNAKFGEYGVRDTWETLRTITFGGFRSQAENEPATEVVEETDDSFQRPREFLHVEPNA